MHHFLPKRKVAIYKEVRKALRTTSIYIEGDQATTVEGEESILYWYDRWIAKLAGGDSAEWNYDITLSPKHKPASFGKRSSLRYNLRGITLRKVLSMLLNIEMFNEE